MVERVIANHIFDVTMVSEEEFLKRLLETFKLEANEHIKVISSGLLDLEKKPTAVTQKKIIEAIFREVHSLKGAARSVNLTDIEVLCKSLESIFDLFKRNDISPTSDMFDVLHQAVDFLITLLRSINMQLSVSEESLKSGQFETLQNSLKNLVRATKKMQPSITGQASPETTEPAIEPAIQVSDMTQNRELLLQKQSTIVETIRISTKKLDSLLLQAEELLSVKLAFGERVTDLQAMVMALNQWKKEQITISGDIHALQRELKKFSIKGEFEKDKKNNSSLAMLLKYIEWNDTFFKSLERNLTTVVKSTKRDHYTFSIMTDTLLDDMKQVLMLPFSSLLEIFPRLVRELSRDQGKEIELVLNGTAIEIDRRILEEMKDPLIHLIRNCIDHGIEKPQERKQKKKFQRGTVKIDIAQKNGSKVEIRVSDDGAGIDYMKVRAAALKLGIVPEKESEKMSVQQTLSLIFQSGVTLSSIITDISGRGLGLAIVLEKVEKLGGTISVETQIDVGTTFCIVLPLTLAIFHGILIRLDEQFYVFPTTHVEQVVRVKKEEVKTVENRDTIQFHGRVVSLVRLTDVLGITRKNGSGNTQNDKLQIIVLGIADNRIAFLVDEIMGEQEVLIKTLGKQLVRVKNIAGATVLGTGKVVPILNVYDLMKSAVKISVPAQPIGAIKKEITEIHSVLIVEDSITSRTLLQNILEGAGYKVDTAVDGIDAFTRLRTDKFDIVVSDVDMPRMNGFDLTAKIRSEKKLADIPVVLVTALESREDRERGIDVGANAYIVKSSFDQKNLLEVIRQLI